MTYFENKNIAYLKDVIYRGLSSQEVPRGKYSIFYYGYDDLWSYDYANVYKLKDLEKGTTIRRADECTMDNYRTVLSPYISVEQDENKENLLIADYKSYSFRITEQRHNEFIMIIE